MNSLDSISIVYEDKDFMVINKPAGIITHPKNIDDKQPSLSDWVNQNYPELRNVGEPFDASGSPFPRHGIVHRLDKDTSGLIIIAKNIESFEYFKNLFQSRSIQKVYLALVMGHPKDTSGTINAPLGRIGMKRTTQLIGKKLIDGKEAVTEYKVVKKYKKYSLLEVTPKTGRTHQIRVHLKSIGCPIVGDPIYGLKETKVPRLFLHATKLSFSAPDGKALTLETDIPEDLDSFLKTLE